MKKATKKKKRVKKLKPTFKVYVSYFPDNTYYIGFSSKSGNAYEKYFGSNSEVLEMVKKGNHGIVKETLAEFEKRSHAKMQEFLLQWQCRFDERCRNDMLNIRLRMSFLKDFIPISWEPHEALTQHSEPLYHPLNYSLVP